MKRLCIIPLIVILTACVTSPTPATPTLKIETATVIPATETPIPTDTPIPTNTVEPTPTRDPSIPAEYIKDSSGNYTKTENGVTITWDSERKAGYSLMFDDFLFDERPAVEGILPGTLGLKVFIDAGITNWNKLTVTHPENMSESIHRSAQEAGRSLIEIERTGHAIDHPIRFTEGAYLKCLFATAA